MLVEMLPVSSSNVEAIGFDKDERAIYVRFLSGGLYRYLDCDEKLYSSMLEALSMGRFVNKYLKSSKTFEKL